MYISTQLSRELAYELSNFAHSCVMVKIRGKNWNKSEKVGMAGFRKHMTDIYKSSSLGIRLISQ